MMNCEWFGKFPFCKQCKNQNNICLPYAIFVDQGGTDDSGRYY